MKNAYEEAILLTPGEAGLICDFIREQLIPVVLEDAPTADYDVEFAWIVEMALLYDRIGKRLDRLNRERAAESSAPTERNGGVRDEWVL